MENACLWNLTISTCYASLPLCMCIKMSQCDVPDGVSNATFTCNTTEHPWSNDHTTTPVQPLHKDRSNGLGLGLGVRVRVSGLWFIPPFYREPLQIWHKHASFLKTATLLKFNRLFSENRYTFNLVAPPMLMLPWHQLRLPLGLFICCKWSSP